MGQIFNMIFSSLSIGTYLLLYLFLSFNFNIYEVKAFPFAIPFIPFPIS